MSARFNSDELARIDRVMSKHPPDIAARLRAVMIAGESIVLSGDPVEQAEINDLRSPRGTYSSGQPKLVPVHPASAIGEKLVDAHFERTALDQRFLEYSARRVSSEGS